VANAIPEFMTEQNRKYITKEIGKLLSEIWRIKGLAEQEYGSQHPITKKLTKMLADVQELSEREFRKLMGLKKSIIEPKRNQH
jgi:hypothetical protein